MCVVKKKKKSKENLYIYISKKLIYFYNKSVKDFLFQNNN